MRAIINEVSLCARTAVSSIYTTHLLDDTTLIELNSLERQVSIMQKDILGTRRTAVAEAYIVCGRCGKATHRHHICIIQSDVLSDTKSEFEYICPECQKALARGEKDLPLVQANPSSPGCIGMAKDKEHQRFGLLPFL